MTDSTPSAAAAETEVATPVLQLGQEALITGEKLAREALAELAPAEQIGALVATRTEDARTATLLFECLRESYVGWHWAASITQVADTEPVTLLETELISGEESIVAPEWVPWSVRLAQFREARAAAAAEEAAAAAAAAAELDEDDVDPEDDLLENDFTDFDDEIDGVDIDELDADLDEGLEDGDEQLAEDGEVLEDQDSQPVEISDQKK